jgi:hypothetical protein
MKIKISYFILLGLFINLMTSCVDKEEYSATITVVNKTGVEVTDFTFEGKEVNYSKKIDKISSGEEQNFEIKWIGKSSALFGSIEVSLVRFTTDYNIGTTNFNVENEKDAKIDSNGNYYSEKDITNGTKLKVEINENGYEIISF